MFSSAKADIVTGASGDATVYLSHGQRKPNGFLVVLKYTPGDLDTGAVLTITGEDSGIPILIKTGAGTSVVFYYPRATNISTGATLNGWPTEFIPIRDERIKVVVSAGGNVKSGSIEAILQVGSPY